MKKAFRRLKLSHSTVDSNPEIVNSQWKQLKMIHLAVTCQPHEFCKFTESLEEIAWLQELHSWSEPNSVQVVIFAPNGSQVNQIEIESAVWHASQDDWRHLQKDTENAALRDIESR